MIPERFVIRRPLLAGMLFQGALIPLALGLALLFGLSPWKSLEPTATALLVAIAGTAPPIVALRWLAAQDYPSMRELEALLRELLGRLFADARPGAVLALSLLAGFGEELLFRGVLQSGLAELTGPVFGIVIAALVFGLVHSVNALYFAVATAMGLYLGVLYQVTGSLLIVCLIHAFYDWIAIRMYLRRSPGS